MGSLYLYFTTTTTMNRALPDAASRERGERSCWSDAVGHRVQRRVGVIADEPVTLARLAQQHPDRQLQILHATTAQRPCRWTV